MKVRHQKKYNSEVNTRYGILKLDGGGFVSNLDEIEASPEEVATLPNMVDGEVFPPARIYEDGMYATADEQSIAEAAKNSAASVEEVTEEVHNPTDDDYLEIIRELMIDEGNRTSEGSLDMEVLNSTCRLRGMDPISVGARDRLQNLLVDSNEG